MSNILIAIVTHNGLPLTKLALRSAMSQQPACDVMIVENGSVDGTLAYVKSKPVALMAFTKQLSLAACWNAALKAAWRMKYEAVLMLNNDVAIQDMTARILYAVNEPFVTCVSVGSEEQLAPRTDDEVPWLKANARPNPDYSCWMMRKSVTDQGIWFDESCYPAYTEDSSHHVELHRHGISAICIDLPYLHFGASTLKQASEKEAIVIRRGAQRNRERFKAKYGCLPGTPEYEKLFSPGQFGIDDPNNRLKRQARLGIGALAT